MELVHEKQKFKNIPEEQIKSQIQTMGFIPLKITNTVNYEYRPHQHPSAKLLVILRGSMKVRVRDKYFDCDETDLLIIPGDTPHSAVVGEKGCVFFWSERSNR